MKDLGNLFMMF